MRPIIYLTAIALGFFGLGAGIRPEYSVEIFCGIFLPYIVAAIELFLVLQYKSNDPQSTTKVLIKGFVGKMVLFGVYITTLIYFYSFEPYPFVFSFSGSFLAFHTLEALILKSLFQS